MGSPAPSLLMALTLKWYFLPSSRPGTVQLSPVIGPGTFTQLPGDEIINTIIIVCIYYDYLLCIVVLFFYY